MIFDSAGNLYGTTNGGGKNDDCGGYGCGVVFELSPVGTSWTETVLYNFCSQARCTDGANPSTGLIFDVEGNLYGTASTAPNEYGIVFELSLSGGNWTEQVLFTGGGIGTEPGLAINFTGNIFGFSSSELFELSPDGKGGWALAAEHIIKFPGGALSPDQVGNLYGTTNPQNCSRQIPRTFGNAFKVSEGKNRNLKQSVLYTFDGNCPLGEVALDDVGNIYGIASGVGKQFGNGIVYKLTAPTGKGKYQENILWGFTGVDGLYPSGGLIVDSEGDLYGVTSKGGSYGTGVVFEVTPSSEDPAPNNIGIYDGYSISHD